MEIHIIHDCSSTAAVRLLSGALSTIVDTKIIKNYHPDYSTIPGNLFYILNSGRYSEGNGAYYIIEDDGVYICSAGWNTYELDRSVGLILSRMYVAPAARGKFTVGKHILPLAYASAITKHNILWMTFNDHNSKYRKWFEEYENSPLVPDLYRKFSYIGTKDVYYTQQHVYQYLG